MRDNFEITASSSEALKNNNHLPLGSNVSIIQLVVTPAKLGCEKFIKGAETLCGKNNFK